MAVDRQIPTSPPANTSMAFFAGQVQEELTPLWQGVILELSLTASGNALSSAASPTLTAYTDAKYFMGVMPVTNTGAVTLNIDGLGARQVVTAGNAFLQAGDLAAGQVVMFYYDSTLGAFRVVSALSSGLTVAAPTEQWQVLQADATLTPGWSQEIFGGNW